MQFKSVIISILAILMMPVLSSAGPVPDTGQTKCYNNTEEIPCPQPGEPFFGQDAQYDGPARSYTKLGQNGVELPDTATQNDGWIMTRDNVTGLIWEIKTDDGSVHDKDNKYTWYDSNPETNGGYAGASGDGTDTEDFIANLNGNNFGGFTEWRLPTVKELCSLVNLDISHPGPAIDVEWFPSTAPYRHWTSNTWANPPGCAWHVSFGSGIVGHTNSSKTNSYRVRAVRAEQ